MSAEDMSCTALVGASPTGDGIACGVRTEKRYQPKVGVPGHEHCTPETCPPMPFCDECAQIFRDEGLLAELNRH